MAKHDTHKATRQGRDQTLARKQQRRLKYRPEHQALDDLAADLRYGRRLVSLITVQEGMR